MTLTMLISHFCIYAVYSDWMSLVLTVKERSETIIINPTFKKKIRNYCINLIQF